MGSGALETGQMFRPCKCICTGSISQRPSATHPTQQIAASVHVSAICSVCKCVEHLRQACTFSLSLWLSLINSTVQISKVHRSHLTHKDLLLLVSCYIAAQHACALESFTFHISWRNMILVYNGRTIIKSAKARSLSAPKLKRTKKEKSWCRCLPATTLDNIHGKALTQTPQTQHTRH